MLRAFLLWVLLAVSTSSFAVNSLGLYQMAMPVAGQDAKLRQKAVRAAFSGVLVRVSGSRKILKHPEIRKALTLSNRYVQQYGYRDFPVVEPLLTDDVDPLQFPPPPVQQQLVVQFDEQAINKLLKDNRQPIWGKERPATLFWVVVEEEGTFERHFVSPVDELAVQLSDYAEKRGIPVLMPLLDLEDQVNLKVSEVWAGFSHEIFDASERYTPEAVVTIRLWKSMDGLSWKGESVLFLDGGVDHRWEVEGEALPVVLDKSLAEWGDVLSEKYALVFEPSDAVRQKQLQVNNIHQLSEFSSVKSYLSAIQVMEKVTVLEVSPSHVLFQLNFRSTEEELMKLMALGQVLRPVEQQESQGEEGEDTLYTIFKDSDPLDEVWYYRLEQ
jgi:uncharacterized protein